MAEIQIARKANNRGWLWALLALAVIAALAWWFLSRSRVANVGAAAGDVVTDSAQVAGSTARPAARPDAVASAPVASYLAWADSTRARGDAGVDHAYVATGIERLSGAIGDLAVRDSLAGSSVAEQVGALNRLAVQVTQDREALSHADLVHAAFQSSAKLLGDIQRRRAPNAAGAVAGARAAAEAIDKGRPLLDQKAQVERFFTQAAAAVRAMST